jgi:hypothetical protein
MQAILLLAALVQSPLAELNALAKDRNVDGILKVASPEVKPADLKFLKANGAFGVGSKGWTVELLDDKKGGHQYAVFTTLLTTQDYGDQVFKFDGGKLGAKIPETDPGAYVIRQLIMKISFPKAKTARLETLTACELKDASKPTMFRLGGNYRVSSVKSDTGSELPYSQAGGVVLFRPEQDKKSQYFILTYEGVVDNPGFAGAITDNEVMLTNDYFWPSTARSPVTFNALVRTPKSWEVVTNGERVGVEEEGDEKITHYRMSVPIVYLSLSAGLFGKAEAKHGDITYRIWSTKMTDDEMKLQTELYPPIIEFYSKTFSPHPFTQYGAVDTELYGGGALEAYSYATYGHGWLPAPDAHEPSHTWFGGILANNYLKSMWNESFASWCEGLYPRENEIGDKAEKRLAFVSVPGFNAAWNATTQMDSGVDWGGVSSALGYGRGGDVLQQLEYEMGTEAMVKAVRKWIADQPKGEPANWEGFIAACGPEWTWFFDQWHKRPGAPKFTISNVHQDHGQMFGNVAFNGPTYRLKTQVAFNTPQGWVYDSVTLDQTGAFSVACPARASEVVFDPLGRLPMAHKNSNQATYGATRRMSVVLDSKHPDWMPQGGRKAEWDGKQRANLLFVGHPATSPVVAELCSKIGFVVKGDSLTYKGTTIDLNHGAALALIDLGDGQQCGLRLGKTRSEPTLGSARTALTDDLGNFLRGDTDPRKEEGLVFKL